MVGASGAIAGVMGAYLVLYPHSRVLMLFPFPCSCSSCPRWCSWDVVPVQFLNGINQLPVFEKNAISGGVASGRT
jgi:membrane associated rhomboid family serine protease